MEEKAVKNNNRVDKKSLYRFFVCYYFYYVLYLFRRLTNAEDVR